MCTKGKQSKGKSGENDIFLKNIYRFLSVAIKVAWNIQWSA